MLLIDRSERPIDAPRNAMQNKLFVAAGWAKPSLCVFADAKRGEAELQQDPNSYLITGCEQPHERAAKAQRREDRSEAGGAKYVAQKFGGTHKVRLVAVSLYSEPFSLRFCLRCFASPRLLIFPARKIARRLNRWWRGSEIGDAPRLCPIMQEQNRDPASGGRARHYEPRHPESAATIGGHVRVLVGGHVNSSGRRPTRGNNSKMPGSLKSVRSLFRGFRVSFTDIF